MKKKILIALVILMTIVFALFLYRMYLNSDSISYKQAVEIAEDDLRDYSKDSEHELGLDLENVTEKDYGWVFIPNTNKYIETRDDTESLIGQCAILVLKRDGSVHRICGSANPLEYYLEEFERKHLLL